MKSINFTVIINDKHGIVAEDVEKMEDAIAKVISDMGYTGALENDFTGNSTAICNRKTFAYFQEKFRPIENPRADEGNEHLFNTSLATRDLIKSTYSNRVIWTVIDAEGGLYLIPGYHRADSFGYCICMEPWVDEHDEYRYDEDIDRCDVCDCIITLDDGTCSTGDCPNATEETKRISREINTPDVHGGE